MIFFPHDTAIGGSNEPKGASKLYIPSCTINTDSLNFLVQMLHYLQKLKFWICFANEIVKIMSQDTLAKLQKFSVTN